MERLGCYEVHLDRKLERMLTMLLRLKKLRLLPSRANPFGKMSSLTRIGWGERRRYVGRFDRLRVGMYNPIVHLSPDKLTERAN